MPWHSFGELKLTSQRPLLPIHKVMGLIDSWASCTSPLPLPGTSLRWPFWGSILYVFHLYFWVEIVTLDLYQEDPEGKPHLPEWGAARWQLCDLAAPPESACCTPNPASGNFPFYIRQQTSWSPTPLCAKFKSSSLVKRSLRSGRERETPGAEAAPRAPSPPVPPSLTISISLLPSPCPESEERPVQIERLSRSQRTALYPWRVGGGGGSRRGWGEEGNGARPARGREEEAAAAGLPIPAPSFPAPGFSPREDGGFPFVPPLAPVAAEVAGGAVRGRRRRGEAEGALWRWAKGNGPRGISPCPCSVPAGGAHRGILYLLAAALRQIVFPSLKVRCRPKVPAKASCRCRSLKTWSWKTPKEKPGGWAVRSDREDLAWSI